MNTDIKKLRHRINKTKKAIEREQEKNKNIIYSAGWVSLLRRERIGTSCRKQTELEIRRKKYENQFRELLEGKIG